MVIDGSKIANKIIAELKKRPKLKKFLAAVLVGENPKSLSFIKQKEKIAKELGVDFRIYRRQTSINQDELRKEVLEISKHKTCGGVIVQLPLPEHLNKHYVCNVIPHKKDVDVLGERALGAFYTGRNPVLPPAVGVVEYLIRIMNYELEIRKVAVIGRGILVGKPVALWLMDKVAELSVFASGTENLKEKLKDFDIIISGVGKANLFGVEDLKDNAIVIDFGYSTDQDGKPHGDFDTSQLATNNQQLTTISYTPTPGGTGPILTAKLFENFFSLNKD